MVLQLLVGAVYELVRESWTVGSILSKYFLLAVVAFQLKREVYSFEKYLDRLEEFSPYFVTGVVALAAVKSLAGLEIEPLLPVVSEVVAWLYMLFLFWRY